MTRAEKISELLASHFSPMQLEVADDSHKHAGHSGANPEGGSHIRITIIAPAFQGMSRIQAHRAVYQVLAEHFAEGLHALQINARA
jgi:BolA protein